MIPLLVITLSLAVAIGDIGLLYLLFLFQVEAGVAGLIVALIDVAVAWAIVHSDWFKKALQHD